MFFTILDFRNVTKLFSDPAFDGDPVRVYEPTDEEEFDKVIDDIEKPEDESGYPLPEDNSSSANDSGMESVYMPDNKETSSRVIYTISGQKVEIVGERVQIIDSNGKLITESLTDYTRKNILGEYATLDEFLQKWSTAKQKYYILDEMVEKGIPIYELGEQFGEDVDMFDVIMHIAYGKKSLGRKTRAEKARQSKFLNEYQGKAREVLEALINKYESTNLRAIEESEILKVQPLSSFGTPIEIANIFGGIEAYQTAVNKLEQQIYEEVA